MNVYSEKIFPVINDLLTKQFIHHRAKVLRTAHGKILEVGFGSGVSLESYPDSVSQIFGVEPNPGMVVRAEKRKDSRVQIVHGSAEKLPFADETFDGVASFFTLCSVKDLSLAIREMKRVLKPTGSLFLIEHVAHPQGSLSRRLQKVLDPVTYHLACGCHVDRETTGELERSGFKFSELKPIVTSGVAHVVGKVYRGVAAKV